MYEEGEFLCIAKQESALLIHHWYYIFKVFPHECIILNFKFYSIVVLMIALL